MAVSPRGSWLGWSFSRWYALNKGSVRTIVATLAGALSSWAAAQARPAWVAVLVAIVIGPGAKMLLDSLDYRYSDVDVPPAS